VRIVIEFENVSVFLMSNTFLRSFLISEVLRRNSSMNRLELEMLSIEKLIELNRDKREVSFLTSEFWEKKERFILDSSSIRSSAPYSSGSSDKAMMSS